MLEVVGIRKVEYTSKTTGKDVRGQEVHTVYKDNNTEGVSTKSIYMSERLIADTPQIKVGDKIRPLYNERGWVDTIEVHSK